ncbi:hypothetical protein H5410_013135 [Solanum commersonii]|uniref:Uncharacterized protein n=1 Tax=Solanum commersonii TaxID=4109 RepID=A0A9J6ATL5_SOLCO|nr:hypothetical protein H5410_013135 [Solanum commersonii]
MRTTSALSSGSAGSTSMDNNSRYFVFPLDSLAIIIGFPVDFKFTKSIRLQGGVKSNVIFGHQEGDDYPPTTMDNASGINQLSQDQFPQLVQLLHQVKVSRTEATTSDVSANSTSKTPSVSCLVSIQSTHWILDSGGPSVKGTLVLGDIKDELYQLNSTSLLFKNRILSRALSTRTPISSVNQQVINSAIAIHEPTSFAQDLSGSSHQVILPKLGLLPLPSSLRRGVENENHSSPLLLLDRIKDEEKKEKKSVLVSMCSKEIQYQVQNEYKSNFPSLGCYEHVGNKSDD